VASVAALDLFFRKNGASIQGGDGRRTPKHACSPVFFRYPHGLRIPIALFTGGFMKNRMFVIGLALLVLAVPSCSKDSGKTKVAFISNNSFDFWLIAEAGAKKAAKEFDVALEFKMPAGGGSAEAQQQIIEDLLSKGVKGIAISPNDAKNLVSFLKDKVSSKIPLITQDSDVPDPSARRCYIGTHNYRAGRAAGALVEKACPKGGKIIIFVGKLDVQNAIERRQGVLDYLAGRKNKNDEIGDIDPADATNLKVGKYVLIKTQTDGGNREECQQRAEELITKHPDACCLVGLWEYNPPAMLLAVQNLKSKSAIVAFDENYETLEGIQNGHIIGTVVQNPYEFGYQSIKILAGLAKGDNKVLSDRKDLEKDNCIYIPHRIITKENVDGFYKELKAIKGK
jgi:ribose transport system substrate-binding protein